GVLSALGTEAATPVRRREPRPGDRVRLRTVSQPARVLRELFDGGFEVEAGALRLQIAAGDIIEVLPPIAQTTKPVLDHHAPGALEITSSGFAPKRPSTSSISFLTARCSPRPMKSGSSTAQVSACCARR